MIGTISGDIIGSPYVKNPLPDTNSIFFPLFSSSVKVDVDKRRGDVKTRSFESRPGSLTEVATAVAWWMSRTDRTREDWDRAVDVFLRGRQPSGPEFLGACGILADLSVNRDDTYRTLTELAGYCGVSPEMAKGAQAWTAVLFSVADNGADRVALQGILRDAGYDASRSASEIRPFITGMVVDGGKGKRVPGDGKSVREPRELLPAALAAFLESGSFEEAVRRGTAVGGDSALVAGLAGMLAERRWEVPDDIRNRTFDYFDQGFINLVGEVESRHGARVEQTLGRDLSVNGLPFEVISMDGYHPVYVIPESEEYEVVEDAVEEIAARTGGDFEIIRPSERDAFFAKLSAQVGADGSRLDGTYFEHPRPSVRTLWFQDDVVRSATMRNGERENGGPLPSVSTRLGIFNKFQELRVYASRVRDELERKAGFDRNEYFLEAVKRNAEERLSGGLKGLALRKDITFTESSGGYAARTLTNAKRADATLAFAVDFETRGEVATRNACKGRTYIPCHINTMSVNGKDVSELDASLPVSDMFVKRCVAQIYNGLGEAARKGNPVVLNIAGNGMYTLSGSNISQERCNEALVDILSGLMARGIRISGVRTGGQGGFDLAGAVAARAMGIPVEVHAPKGYVYRICTNDEKGYKDLKDEKGFKKRFSSVDYRALLDRHLYDMSRYGSDVLFQSVDRMSSGMVGAPAFRESLENLSSLVKSGSVHFASAYYPVVLKDAVEIWQGDVLRGRAGINGDGLFKVDTNAMTGSVYKGEGIEGVLATQNVFPKAADMTAVRSILDEYCLDYGRIEDEDQREMLKEDDAGKVYDEARAVRKIYASNVERAVDDLTLEMGEAVVLSPTRRDEKAAEAREERREESIVRNAGKTQQEAIDSVAHKGSVFTIGHSNMKAEEFDALLRRHGIDVLVDIRTFTFSKFTPQFNKKELESRMPGMDVEYHHFPEFGEHQMVGKSKDRWELTYGEVFKSDEFKKGMGCLRDCVKEGYRVAVMSSEQDPLDSHRMLMIGRALQHPEVYGSRAKPIDVQHITRKGYVLSHASMESKLLDWHREAVRGIGEPINIFSKGNALARKLTNVGNDVGVRFRGMDFVNSEHAYQTWKSGSFDQEGFDAAGGKVSTSRGGDVFALMTEIITAKLSQHPDLVSEISANGGARWLLSCRHDVLGDMYWESNGKDGFIKALTNAYMDVAGIEGSRIGIDDSIAQYRIAAVSRNSVGEINDPDVLAKAYLAREEAIRKQGVRKVLGKGEDEKSNLRRRFAQRRSGGPKR